jgi:hypothetical protein
MMDELCVPLQCSRIIRVSDKDNRDVAWNGVGSNNKSITRDVVEGVSSQGGIRAGFRKYARENFLLVDRYYH